MASTPRSHALRNVPSASPSPRFAGGRQQPLTETFGSKVFNDTVQRRRLTPEVYQALRQTIDRGEKLDRKHADAVADASSRSW